MKITYYMLQLVCSSTITMARNMFISFYGNLAITDQQVYTPLGSIWFTTQQLKPFVDRLAEHQQVTTLADIRILKGIPQLLRDLSSDISAETNDS